MIFSWYEMLCDFLDMTAMPSILTHEYAHWKDREGNKMNYWPGGKGTGCACGVTKTCAGGEWIVNTC